MYKHLIRLWKDPVWSKVIASGIITISFTAITYLSGYWPILKDFFLILWKFIISFTSIPNWVIGILSIPFILFIWAILYRLKEKVFSNPVTFKNYCNDNFLSLKWVWSYTWDNQITNLYSLCPKCDYQIFPKDSSNYSMIPKYRYICDDCGYDAGTIDEDTQKTEHDIKLKIHKNIRTGKWYEKLNT